MIAHIRGILSEVWGRSCLVSTDGGVGYAVALPAHTFAALPSKGETVAFFTCLVVREDALELYGFETFDERQTFEILIGISKVGARTALAILSAFRPPQLRDAVLAADVSALSRVPGIGQKTAQHICLELKYKLGSLEIKSAPGALAASKPSVLGDVLAVLGNLGYAEDEGLPVARQILKDEPDLDVEGAIRKTLKALAKGKV